VTSLSELELQQFRLKLGMLFQNNAPVIYRYESIEQLLDAEARGEGRWPELPGPGPNSATERG